jgi:hypothetical protein
MALPLGLVEPPGRFRLITLTDVPHAFGASACDTWPTVYKRLKALQKRIGRAGFEWETAAVVEEGPLRKTPHVHLLQVGSVFVPRATLQTFWGARIDVREIPSPPVGLYYLLKNAVSPETLPRHLELNGGRVVHYSRGFLQGLTMAEARRTLTAGSGVRWYPVPEQPAMASGRELRLLSPAPPTAERPGTDCGEHR